MKRILFLVLAIMFIAAWVNAQQPGLVNVVDDGDDDWVYKLTFPDGSVAVADSAATISFVGGTVGASTVANLPGTPSDGDVAVVTDGSTATDCTVGGGATLNVCIYDEGGAAWVIAGDGTGGAGSGSLTTIESSDSQVGDQDIVYLDFRPGFTVTESPDTEINVELDITPTDVTPTLKVASGGLEVKYDSTDFSKDSNGLILGASPTMTGSPVVGTAIVPDASDGAAIGSTSLEWSDLYLADGAIINFGDGQESKITHRVADDFLIVNTGVDFDDGSGASPVLSFTNESNEIATLHTHDDGSFVIDNVTSGVGNIKLYPGATDAVELVASTDSLSFTNATNVWTIGSTGDTITITPDTTVTGDVTVTGGDITLGTTSIFSGGDTASLNNIDAIDATTETTLEAAIDALANLVTVGTVGTGTWEGTDVGVEHGGTGVSTLTDGGVLLGSGTGAITAMSVLTDGQMIVGDGTTDPVAESGATLRTSIGVGTGDSPQFTGIELGHASDTTIARSGAGDLTIEGNAVYRADGTDVAIADGGTGAGTAAAAASALGVGTEDSPQFTGIELSHASDNTLSASSGVLSIEGVALAPATSPVFLTSMEIPSGTSGTTDATGEVFLDTDGDGGDYDGPVLQISTNDATVGYAITTTALPSDDNYIMKYDASTDTVSWESDVSAGTTAWDDISDPDNDGTTTVTFDNAAEATILSNAYDTAGSFLKIDNTDADLANNTYLLDLEYTDDGQANADFVKMSDNNGDVKLTIQEEGKLSIGDDPGDSGIFNLDNAAVISWEDATETTLTHVDNTGLAINLNLEAATITEGGNAVYNSSETPGGELGGTWASPTVDDTGIELTSITVGALLGVDSIDATGAVDMDYGSADVTDHTFVSDGGTTIIDGSIQFPSANGDPAVAGELQYDNTITNFTNGGLVYYNAGAAIKQLVDMTTATATACTDDQVVAYDADADLWYCKDDTTGSGLGANLTSATDYIKSDNGTILLGGDGGTNDGSLDFDFETTAGTVGVAGGGDVAVTAIDFGTLNLATDALDLSEGNITNVGEIAVDLVDDDNGAIAIGDGDETVAITSSDWTISTTGTIANAAIDVDNNTVANIENDNIKAGAAIDATKLGDGSISSTEFQYLDGLTADLPTAFTTATLNVSTLLNVDEDVDIDFNAADEEVSIVNSAEYGANGAQVLVQNSDADVGAQMYLLDLDYSVDDGQVNADYIIAQDAGGEVWRLGQDGDVTTTDGDYTTTNGTISAEQLTTTDDATITDDLLLGSGSIVNFNSGDVTITHSSNTLTVDGGNLTLGSNTLTAGATSVTTLDASTDITLGDNDNLNFGAADPDWYVEYNSTNVGMLWSTADTASAAIDTGMFRITADSGEASMTANQEIFEVMRGTTELMALDEDGDVEFAGSATFGPTSGASFLGLNNNTSDITSDVAAATGYGVYFYNGEFIANENGTEVDLLDESDSPTLTGSWDFSGATEITLPTTAANAIGEISVASSGDQLKWHDGTQVITIDTTESGDETDFVLKYNDTTNTFSLGADETAGSPTWNSVGDPTVDVNMIHPINVETQFTYTGAFTTGNQFNVEQLTGNPTGGTLAQIKTADSDVTPFRIYAVSEDLTVKYGTTNQIDIGSDTDAYLAFKVSGDTGDYMTISTTGDVPEVDTAGSTGLNLSADGGDINLRPDGDDDDYIVVSTATNVPSISPNANDAGTLGTAALEWDALYLNDSGVIYGENDQSNTLTSSATGWEAALAFTALGLVTADGVNPEAAADTLGTATAEWGGLFLGDSDAISLGLDQDIQLVHVHNLGTLLRAGSDGSGDIQLELGFQAATRTGKIVWDGDYEAETKGKFIFDSDAVFDDGTTASPGFNFRNSTDETVALYLADDGSFVIDNVTVGVGDIKIYPGTGKDLYILGGGIVLPDADYVGSTTAPTAIQFEADGDIVLTNNIELGHATANTLSASGGVLSIEGNVVHHTNGTDIADADIADDITLASTKKISTTLTTEQLRLNYDATNYATWTVDAEGAMTVATVDADAANANLTFSPDGTIILTPATDVVGAFTAGSVTSDAGVGGTTITASTGFALGDTDWIGITGNEIITFNAAGSIAVTGATMDVDGAFTASTLAADTTISGTAITGTSFVIGSADISEAELEIIDGATVTTAELNILDTVTATAAELNYLDIATLGTGVASKAVVLDGSGNYTAPAGTWNLASVTGITLRADEIETADIATDAVTMDAVDADGNFTSLTGNWTTTGTLQGRALVGDDAVNNDLTTAEINGMIFDNDGDTWNLPDIDAAAGTGWWVCFYSSTAAAVTVNPDDEDKIRDTYDDGALETAGTPIVSSATAGNMICMTVTDFSGEIAHWSVTGENGTWTP